MFKHILTMLLCGFLLPLSADAQDASATPHFLRDRGPGTPTSMFGTYVERGQLLVYPFYEYELNRDAEYKPAELGYGQEKDYTSEFRGSEYLLFLGYGLTRQIGLEFEGALMTAEQNKSPRDPSAMPSEIEESGIGDVQTEINYYWLPERATRPGAFSYLEISYPFSKRHRLTGTPNFEYKFGGGVLRGFRFGTLTVRAAVEYHQEDHVTELGEMAVEYLKRLSPQWRTYIGVEASQDVYEFITEFQYHLRTDRLFFKFNNAFGLSPKAPDWAPEYGLMIVF